MHEVLGPRTPGNGGPDPLVDDRCGPRRGLDMTQRTQVLEEGGIPTRLREVRMRLDEGFRLRRQAIPGNGHPQHPGVEGRGNFLEQPVGRQVCPCQEPVGPLIHGCSLARLSTGTPAQANRLRDAPWPIAPSVQRISTWLLLLAGDAQVSPGLHRGGPVPAGASRCPRIHRCIGSPLAAMPGSCVRGSHGDRSLIL
jgi:hypothetical protein